jgi:uncharacterized membrane protein YhhN
LDRPSAAKIDMKPALYPIPVLVIAFFLLIRAEILQKRRQVFIFKPMATLLVITTALLSLLESTRNGTYTIGVLMGLLLSLGGDVALMFDEDPRAFALGLVLFLLAHIAYTIVFTLLGRFSAWDGLSFSLLLAAGVGFYTLIQANLGKLRLPVIAYMIVISVMVSRAASALVSPLFRPGQALMIVGGAVLFYISDVILAANRFWRPLRYNRISLAFYYGGQLLIALAASYFA